VAAGGLVYARSLLLLSYRGGKKWERGFGTRGSSI